MTLRSESKGAGWLVFVVGAVWLALGGVDWTMRFTWFGWHRALLIKASPETAAGASTGFAQTNRPGRGGDLTRLVGIPSFAAPYEEERAGSVFWVDEYGYRNRPPTAGKQYPIVTVGDSYMNEGPTFDGLFPNRLAAASGQPVYNHAATGRGSFFGLIRFLWSKRFQDQPPEFLVWGLLEREIAAPYFGGMVWQIKSFGQSMTQAVSQSHVNLAGLSPASLKRSLPNSSAFAQVSAKVWNLARYELFGRIHDYVVVPKGPVAGKPVLFYRESLDAMKWPDEFRRLPYVVTDIGYVNTLCAERGIRLVVVLIPDKERVYEDQVPDRYKPLPSSCLDELADRLNAAGILAINLLPAFRDAAARGRLLYWGDDTHWNAEGIDLAARTVWDALQSETRAPRGRRGGKP